MAPEAAVLKRKRSLPSQWWAVNGNATPQGDAPALVLADKVERAGKKGEKARRSLSAVTGNASGAGSARSSVVGKGNGSGENAHAVVDVGGSATRKTSRRGMSHATSKSSKRKGDGEVDPLAAADIPASKRIGRPSSTTSAAPAAVVSPEQGEGSSKSLRRGRSSNTVAEIRGVAITAQAVGVSGKKGHTVSVRPEADDELAQNKLTPRTGKQAQKSDSPAVIRSEIDDKRSPLTQTRSSAVESTRKRKSARISEVAPEASNSNTQTPSSNENNKRQKRTRLSTSPSQARETHIAPVSLAAEPTSVTGQGVMTQMPGIIIEVETASSKFGKAKPKSSVVVRRNSNSKATQSSSAAGPSQKLTKTRKTPDARSEVTKTSISQKAHKRSSSSSKARKVAETETDVPEKPAKRRRSQLPALEEDAVSEIAERTPFPHLEATTRRVSRLKIDMKWQPLTPACVEQINTLLSDLQRPVIARIKEDRKKTQAGVALKQVSKSLLKKLAKGLPFPPATSRTREGDFDFEGILDRNRDLESQLTPAIHANELLEAELRKEMARLESDQQNLTDLEANAKKEAALRNDNSRNLHKLLQPDISHDAGIFQLDVGLEEKKTYCALDGSIEDENLRDLIKNLSGHMDSMEGNLKQVDGIAESLSRSKGAVQARLFDHLDRSQYEAAVLG